MSQARQSQIGEVQTYNDVASDEKVRKFSEISGDVNPLHLSDEHAEQTQFGERIAHGALIESFISAALAKFDGTVIYISKDINFQKPVYIDENVSARAEIIHEDGNIYYVDVSATTDNGVVVSGEAKVLIE